jgi:hypothetical protein
MLTPSGDYRCVAMMEHINSRLLHMFLASSTANSMCFGKLDNMFAGPVSTMASSSASSLHNGHANGHVNGVADGRPPRPRVGSLSALNKVREQGQSYSCCDALHHCSFARLPGLSSQHIQHDSKETLSVP